MAEKHTLWMPLWVADYLADTQRLTTEQHGAYLLMILDYWRNGPLPLEDQALQLITRLSPSAWRKHKATLVSFFQEHDGLLRHKRIDREAAEARQRTLAYEERGRFAARARWGRVAPKDA